MGFLPSDAAGCYSRAGIEVSVQESIFCATLWAHPTVGIPQLYKPQSLRFRICVIFRGNIGRTSGKCMFFRFPPDARWNPERSVVEFGIGVGEYEGVVRVSRRVFQILLLETPTPESCLEAYYLHRTRLELIAERKVRRRQLTDDGNV